jgi:hypothetical protein
MSLTNQIRHQARLDSLPVGVFNMIVDSLSTIEVKYLSCISKSLRKICVPHIFHNITLEFSKSGFEEIRQLAISKIRQHVVSFTCLAPELLNPSERISYVFLVSIA